MNSETRVEIPQPRGAGALCVRALRQKADRLRNEARIALFRGNYARAHALGLEADSVEWRIREASGHA